jgi:hypothetical protein
MAGGLSSNVKMVISYKQNAKIITTFKFGEILNIQIEKGDFTKGLYKIIEEKLFGR